MILGTITIGCILILILVNGVKIWNLFHKGQKYSWVWSGVTFGLAMLAFTGLYQVFLLNIYNAEQDSIFNMALLEAQTYYQFGEVGLFMALMFTLCEVAIIVGLISWHSLGEPDEPKERGFRLPIKQ